MAERDNRAFSPGALRNQDTMRALLWAAGAAAVLAVAGCGDSTSPARSARGRLAFASNRDGDYEIYVMNADGTAPTQLTSNTWSDREPTFSSDGSRIAFTRDGTIWVMNADGSDQAQLTTSGSDPTFSPDGSEIAFTNNQDIFVMDADGSGTPTNLTNDALPNSDPAYSPDGSKIAFATGPDCNHPCGMLGRHTYDIWVMDADGTGTPLELTRDTEFSGGFPFDDYSPAWSPTAPR